MTSFDPFRRKSQTVTPIYGVPGAGKTHYLIGIVSDLIQQGAEPEEIVFCSFTRAATYSGLSRICARIGVKESRFPYARTVHGLSLRAAGQKVARADVMQDADYQAVAAESGWKITVNVLGMDGTEIVRGSTPADFALSVYNVLRSRCMDPRSFQELPSAVEEMLSRSAAAPSEYLRFVDNLESYKRTHGKIDFADMLELGAAAAPLDVRYAVVDEAQDLSALQWRALHNLLSRAEKIWVAGDDDQAIYDFSGATSEVFRRMGSLPTIVRLEQSRRCPKSVMRVAAPALRYYTDRVPKVCRPSDRSGEARVIVSLADVDLSAGEWMILVRQHAHATKIYQHLRAEGYAYKPTKGRDSIPQNLRDMIRWHTALCRGGTIPAGQLFGYYRLLGGGLVARGWKSKASDFARSSGRDTFSGDVLVEEAGLDPEALALPWFDAFSTLPDEFRHYVQRVLRAGDMQEKPRIEVSTIHGAKGRECDNVIIVTRLGPRQRTSLKRMEDHEYRVAYVAMTRARERLFLLSEPGSEGDWDRYRDFFAQGLDSDQASH